MGQSCIPLHTLDSPIDFLDIIPIEECVEYIFKDVHRHDFYEILWFTHISEPDSMQIDFKDYAISKDHFYIIAPGQIHTMNMKGKKGWVLAISKDFFSGIKSPDFQLRYSPISLVVEKDTLDTCYGLIQLVFIEFKKENRFLLMEAYFKALFIHITPYISKSYNLDLNTERMIRLFNLIDENYILHKDTGFYASQFALTEKRINELSKIMTGKTVKQHIQERLILEIKREISYGRKSFKEISYQLAFNEPSYFTRFFKSQTNLSPEEFRSSLNS